MDSKTKLSYAFQPDEPKIERDSQFRPVSREAPYPHQYQGDNIRPQQPGRLSPGALERKLAAELNLLEGMEESVRQLTDVERTRAVSLAQQETVTLAQILKVRMPQKVVQIILDLAMNRPYPKHVGAVFCVVQFSIKQYEGPGLAARSHKHLSISLEPEAIFIFCVQFLTENFGINCLSGTENDSWLMS